MKDYTDIIDSPVITEKSAIKMQNDNVYTFKVAKDADKTQIKKAVERLKLIRKLLLLWIKTLK